MGLFKILILLLGLLFLAIAGLLIFWRLASSDELSVSHRDYLSAKLPASFSFKICQLGDLHNHSLTYVSTDLRYALQSEKPEAVVFTGDMIDKHTTERDFSHLDELLSSLGSIPIYFVIGNHERNAPQKLRERCQSLFLSHGARDLDSARLDLGNGLVFTGIRDPGEGKEFGIHFGEKPGDVPSQLARIGPPDKSKVNLILAHRPRYAPLSEAEGYDLQLSGHTHGGQVTLKGGAPFNAPRNPYISGFYQVKGLSLYVSRGLGMSYHLPFRYHCPAELSVITIRGTAG
jgi:hypothetical protein